MSATSEVTVQFKEEGLEDLRSQVQALSADLEKANESLAELKSARLQVVSEPLTYQARLVRDPSTKGGLRAISTRENHCYVQDLALAELRGDEAAKQRLRRHEREMKTLADEREHRFHPSAEYEYESRAVNWASGLGGYFAPPLWIVEHFATVPTPARVLSEEAPKFELPIGAQSVNLPAWSAGAEVDVPQLGAGDASVDTIDTPISSAVATIAGNYDAPMQMLEQSPQGAHLDWIAFTNMESRYGYKLELQMINGTGAQTPQGSGNNQLLGILNNTAIPSSNVISYTITPPTVASMIQTATPGQGGPLAQAIAAIGNNRKLPPEHWMMTTSRGAWIASGEVTMPLALVNMSGPGHFALLAYEVLPNDAIPTTLGANGGQDAIIACRPSDWLVLESERRTNVYHDVLSGALMARIQMRRYVAALLLFPTSVAYLSGAGMVVPSGF